MLKERLLHLPTTGLGVAAGGLVVALLKSMDCHVPNDIMGMVSLIPVILGALSK